MLLKLTEINFDFTDDFEDELDVESQEEIYDDVMNRIWEVDDEDELADVISDNVGWCINSLDYVVIAESH
jgi:hypothetical protein